MSLKTQVFLEAPALHYCQKMQAEFTWTRSQMVRKLILVGILAVRMTVLRKDPNSEVSKNLLPAVKLVSKPARREMRQRIDKLYREKPHLLDGVMREVETVTKAVDSFEQHRPRGRPSNRKRRRGRPADKGLD